MTLKSDETAHQQIADAVVPTLDVVGILAFQAEPAQILRRTNGRRDFGQSGGRISRNASSSCSITSANWIGDPKAEKVETEFADWGRRRFDQGIPLSEIVCVVIILKQHLRRYIRDNGLVDAAFSRIESDYVLPMHLHSLQDLNARVGEFFDEGLYHLARGYKTEARRAPSKSVR